MLKLFRDRLESANPGLHSLKFLEYLKDSGVNFTLPAEFLNNLENASEGVGTLIKHDLHGIFSNVYNLAKQEAEMGIFGIYFMLHKHPLNSSYYEDEETWKTLRELSSMGHSVGMHLDFSEIIKLHGSAIRGVQLELNHFRSKGIEIEFISRHGNTSLDSRIRLCDWIFMGRNQGVELGDLPDFLQPHFESLILKDFFNLCGLSGIFDHTVISVETKGLYTNYLTDNSGSWAMTTPVQIYSGPQNSRIIRTRYLKPSKQELEVITERLLQYNTMILIHPQWYIQN